MRLGRHKVLQSKFQEFELNEKEQKELKSVQGQSWFMRKEEKPRPMTPSEGKKIGTEVRNVNRQRKNKEEEAKEKIKKASK